MDSNLFTRLSDGELAGMFSSGDAREDAFGELVRRHAAMVLRTCRRITGNSQDGEDAAQMVFATLAARAGELVASRSLAGWLYSTAWHVSRRHRRSSDAMRRRHGRHATRLSSDEVLDGGAVADEETLLELYRAIEMLPPEYGQAIVLHHLQGMTVQQVSELMGCAVGTTAARLSRARAMMRERLAWRGVMLSLGGLEAVLLAELKREIDEAELMHWIHHLPIDLEKIVAESNNLAAVEAGAATGATMIRKPSPHRAIAMSCAATGGLTRFLCTVCVTLLLGVSAIAAPLVFQSATSMFSMHLRGDGSASAETNSAGAAQNPTTSSQSSGSTTSVPEPGTGAILLMGSALLGRRRRKNR